MVLVSHSPPSREAGIMADRAAIESAESLRRLLELISTGEVEATGDEHARLEGALTALAAVVGPPRSGTVHRDTTSAV